MKNNRNLIKGVSLIVLVITIIIVIIIAGTIILSFLKNNPIEGANKAMFFSDIDSFKNELLLYNTKKSTETMGEYESRLMYADNTKIIYNGVSQPGNVYSIIPDLNKYLGEFSIIDGELTYVGTNEKRINFSSEYGLKCIESTAVEQDTTVPTIEVENTAIAELPKNTEVLLSSLFSANFGSSGGNIVCKINDIEYSTVLGLQLGTYDVVATAVGNNGLVSSNTATKQINITMSTATYDNETYYLLSGYDDFEQFRTFVNNGNNKINAKLMSNIEVPSTNLYPSKTYSVQQMNQSGNVFTSTGIDSFIWFNNLDVKNIDIITVKLKTAIAANMNFQVFYAPVGENLSESKSVKTTVIAGTKEFSVIIPKGDYRQIRYDFGDISGINFDIEALTCQTSSEQIGTLDYLYEGKFDGSGYAINNLYFNSNNLNIAVMDLYSNKQFDIYHLTQSQDTYTTIGTDPQIYFYRSNNARNKLYKY